ncbi:MAG: Ig-like domain-containing protein, partial [Methylococcaceae bacterium]|nr:Ig-like domain-containing protein [Methylococcaceae bacterium]
MDTTAPATTITNNPFPSGFTNSTSSSFAFTGNDGLGAGGLTFECKLDSGAFAACTSATSYTGLLEGTHTFQVRAIDTAGNSDQSPASYTWTVDTTPPSATLSSLVNSPTNSSPILVTITFSEPVDIGPGTGDLNITNSPADPPISGGPTVYTFNLSPSANGQVTAQYLAGSAVDLAGNTNTDSNTFSINFDTDAPTVTINQASDQSDPTNASPINFTVVFSEPIADFMTGDVMLSGTAGASTATVSGSGTTYNVAVSGMTGSGTVIASLAAGIATDAAGNANLASTSTDNIVTRNLAPQTTLVLSANPTTIAINAISNLSTTGGSG